MNRHNHIIQRQAIEVKLASGENAAAVHDRVRNIYTEKIIPFLDILFSELTNDEMILRINNLQLDLGVVEVDKLEEQFAEKALYALRESLEKKLQFDIADQDMELLHRQKSFSDAFFYFLESGQLPWSGGINDLAVLEKEISNQSAGHATLKSKLFILFTNQSASVKRLVFQFSDQFLQFITQLYLPSFKPVELLDEMRSFLLITTGSDPVYLRDFFWQTVYKYLITSEGTTHTVIIKELASIACEKHHLSSAQFLLSVSQSGATVFPYLHSVFIQADENKQKITEWTIDNKTAIENSQDIITTGEEGQELMKGDSDFKGANDGNVFAKEDLPVKESKDTGQEIPVNDKLTEPGSAVQQEGKVNEKDNQDLQELQNNGRKNGRTSDTNIQKRHVKKQPAGTIIYPELSGLVILHPFLSSFFTGLALTDGKEFLNDEALYKAIALLGYMATGETDVQEHRLIMPKLLCGMDLSAPVKKVVYITPEERDEADKLLNAVITHWTALKNTSRDGLRDTFLKREGKLSRTDNGWQLEVERKTWDILLSRLPWGFSMIKFPWMKDLVFVNWG